MRWASALLVLLVSGFVSIDSGVVGAVKDTTGPTAQVACKTRIQVIPRRGPAVTPRMRRHSVRVGPIYFLGARDLADERRDAFEPRSSRTTPIKAPIMVHAGDTAELTLQSRSAAHSDIEVGLDQAPYRVRADSVVLEACPPGTEVAGRRVGRYTPFNGGLRVDGAQCLRITARVGGTDSVGRIAVGRRTCR